MTSTKQREQPHFTVLSVPARTPLPASRHGNIEQLTDDVFFVRGRMPTTPKRPLFARIFLHFSRTMTIIRHQNNQGEYELTLLNTIRLNDAVLAQLEALGTVKNIVRLGSFHGIDDAFYVQHYDAEYWIVDGMKSAEGLETTPRLLSETSAHGTPIPGARIFIFTDIAYPEAVYILPSNESRPGVAISTDSIQNHTSIWDIDNSLFVSLAIWRIGLLGKARLGPIWLREQTPRDAETDPKQNRQQTIVSFFRPKFERLVSDFDFDILVSGHGWPIRSNAKSAVRDSMNTQLAIPSDKA